MLPKTILFPLGVLLNTDSQNVIQSVADLKLIKPPWDTCVSNVRATYLNVLGHELTYGIYIRGSVATGNAVPNVSDIDAVAITSTPVGQRKKTEIRCVRKDLESRCSVAAKYEMPVIFIDSLHKEDRYFPWRFTLKTQSVCIYGDDIVPMLPSCRVD